MQSLFNPWLSIRLDWTLLFKSPFNMFRFQQIRTTTQPKLDGNIYEALLSWLTNERHYKIQWFRFVDHNSVECQLFSLKEDRLHKSKECSKKELNETQRLGSLYCPLLHADAIENEELETRVPSWCTMHTRERLWRDVCRETDNANECDEIDVLLRHPHRSSGSSWKVSVRTKCKSSDRVALLPLICGKDTTFSTVNQTQ